ncbi:hypothetical protein [Shouchella miscanthi]|uniref:hypothetical protein n=1 Tax=Shouchella miscanthi TaxID=2598861 RepID=UPI00119D9748|nr:hypothetical protein [Shouchella miscanthi]
MDYVIPILLAVLLVGSVTVVVWTLREKNTEFVVNLIPIFILELVAAGFIFYGLIVQNDIRNPFAVLGISMILLAFFPLLIIVKSLNKRSNSNERDFN